MILGIIAQGAAGGLAPSYPVSIAVPGGPTAEISASFWTAYQSGLPSTAGGSYYAISATAQYPWHGQVIDIPSAMWADIDAGILKVTRTDEMSSFTDADSMSAAIDCLAADYTYLGGRWTGWINAPTDVWNDYSVEALIPPGTRKLRVHQRGRRVSGTENSAYYRNIRVEIAISGFVFVPLYARRGGNAADWTMSVGSMTVYGDTAAQSAFRTAKDETGATGSGGWVGGFTVANYPAYQQFAVSALPPDAQVALAAGDARFFYRGILCVDNHNEDDAQAYLTSMAGASQLQIADTGRLTSTPNYGHFFDLEIDPLDVSADALRIFLRGYRTHGSYLDAGGNFFTAGLYYPV